MNITQYIQTALSHIKKITKSQLTTPTSAEKDQNNSTSLNEYDTTNEPIEFTPFRMVGDKQKGYAATFGKYKLTDEFKTQGELLRYLEQNHYTVTSNMIIVMPAIMTDINENLVKTK